MFRLNKLLKCAPSFLLPILISSVSIAAIPEKELLSAIGVRLDRLESSTAWKEFIKKNGKAFPPNEKDSIVLVDKEEIALDGDTYTLGTGFRQVFVRADFERVKKILNTPSLWKNLYGLDGDAEVSRSGENFRARIFKKIPVISNQDYILDYKNFERDGIWFQRAKQESDKNEFALRDNLKAIEKTEDGVIYREYSVVYILRWYLRALGPQVRSVMETELKKLNTSFKCIAESPNELSQKLAAECGKLSK